MANIASYSLHGTSLLSKVEELIAAGNTTRITITDHNGMELMSFPVAAGQVLAALLPVVAAVGAMAALMGQCTVHAEQRDLTDDVYDHMNN